MKLKKAKAIATIEEVEKKTYVTKFNKGVTISEGLDILIAALCQAIKAIAKHTGKPLDIWCAVVIHEIKRQLECEKKE